MSSVSVRSYLAAGVAAVGVGAVALSPVQPVSGNLALAPQHAAQLAVDLAAAVSPIDNLVAVLQATGDNIGTLVDNWASGLYVAGTLPFPANTVGNGNLGNRTGGYATGTPLPAIQQVIQNVVTYFGELPDIGTIVGQIFDNVGNVFQAPFAAGVNKPGRLDGLAGLLGTLDNFNQNVNATPYIDLGALGEFSQRDIGALLPAIAGESYASLESIVNFATTPISGVLVGAIGPIVAPVLSLVNSASAVFDALGNSDFEGALFELINAPVNAIGAFLNGGPTLDLTPIVKLLGVDLPTEITSIGLKMGGLLSPGGVAFDALSAVAESNFGLLPEPITITVPGLPVGPIGALANLGNYIAKSIKVTPPAPTASVRAAAAETASPEAITEAAPQVTADRSSDDPAPTKRRVSRHSAATADNGGESASPSAAKAATPKASAARRASR